MDENFVKKVMPHNLEAEKSVIGSMFIDREATLSVSEILSADDFYQKQYGIIYEAMVELYNEDKPIDMVTLQDKLNEKELPPEYSGVEFIRELVIAVPTSANVKHYAQIVQEKAVLRRLIKITEGITNECYLNKESIETILEQTEKQIFNIVQSRGSSDYVDIKDIVLQSLESIEVVAKNKGSVTGVSTGFIDLDYKDGIKISSNLG